MSNFVTGVPSSDDEAESSDDSDVTDCKEAVEDGAGNPRSGEISWKPCGLFVTVLGDNWETLVCDIDR